MLVELVELEPAVMDEVVADVAEEKELVEVAPVGLEVELCEVTSDEDEVVVACEDVVVVVVLWLLTAYSPPAAIIITITRTIPIIAPLPRACFNLDFRDNTKSHQWGVP